MTSTANYYLEHPYTYTDTDTDTWTYTDKKNNKGIEMLSYVFTKKIRQIILENLPFLIPHSWFYKKISGSPAETSS